MNGNNHKDRAGEVEIRDPILIRALLSPWLNIILATGLVFWGCYYLYFAPHSVFLGLHLSSEHKDLEHDCLACHQPYYGVPNESCASMDCHQDITTDSIHNTRTTSCFSCHAEHAGGYPIPAGMDDRECEDCHRKLKADPDSIFHPDRAAAREVTYVPRKIYRHMTHQFPPNYRCWQCHCIGEKTLNTPMEDLFKMESCLKCHEEKGCQLCHQYHQPRVARPRTRTCVNEKFLPELQLKTIGCTPYRGREPGYKNLTICETGEPAATYGKSRTDEDGK